MRVAIMQPTYLPWAGYFNLIGSVDCFVFLDDVQLQRQSWQTRNKILLNGHSHLLVVPIERTSLSVLIKEARISNHDPKWLRRHWKTIQLAYRGAPYRDDLLDILLPLYESALPAYLARWNMSIIRMLSKVLGLQTKFVLSSELACSGKRTEKLINICEQLGATLYRSTAGAQEYLASDQFSERADISLKVQEFIPARYEQPEASEFVSHLSICDVIANLGVEGAQRYIQPL